MDKRSRSHLLTTFFGLFFLFSTTAQSQNFTPIIEFLDGEDRKISVAFDPDRKCIVKISHYKIHDAEFSLWFRRTLDIRYIDPNSVRLNFDEESNSYILVWEFHDASEEQSGWNSLEMGFRAYNEMLDPLLQASKQLDGDDISTARTLSFQQMFDKNRAGAFGKVFQNNYTETFILFGKEGYRFQPMVGFLAQIKAENFYVFHSALIDHKNTHCRTG